MITKSKEIGDLIKLVSPLMRTKFLFSSRMTPVWILLMKAFWLRAIFLRQCHFQNVLLFYQKSSQLRSGGISLSSFSWIIVTLQSYIMNAPLYSCCLLFFTARADTLPGEAKQAKQWTFSVRQLHQKNCHRIKTPSSKLMILVTFCFHTQKIVKN